MREQERPSELQALVDEFEQKMGELMGYTKLQPGERRGVLFDGIEHVFEDLQTVVDQQLIAQHGSADKIRQAIKLVDEAIQTLRPARYKRAYPWDGDAGKYGDWLERVRRLVGRQ